MSEQVVKLTVPGLGIVEGRTVAIKESVERWTELQLEDGSVLRVKPQIVRVVRAEGKWDNDGNPIYVIQGGQVMIIGSAPDNLKQPVKSDSPRIH